MYQTKKKQGSYDPKTGKLAETNIAQPDSLEHLGSQGGQPGDAQGMADPGFVEGLEKAKQELQMDLNEIQQDPMLEGTGQPGELYTPTMIDYERFKYEQQKDLELIAEEQRIEAYLEEAQKRAKKIKSQEIAPRFNIVDVLYDLGFKFIDKSKKGEK